MKKLAISILLFLLTTSVAMANVCRGTYNISERSRSECFAALSRNDVITAGDWSLKKEKVEYGYSVNAVNMPLSSNGIINAGNKKLLEFRCISERPGDKSLTTYPMLVIYLGASLPESPVVEYRFDDHIYTRAESSKDFTIDKSGLVFVFDFNFLINFFERSAFSVRAKTDNGDTVEYIYTLDGGLQMKKIFDCLQWPKS